VNRRSEAAERFAERRRREDEAPRLRDVAPDLIACRIEISERRAGSTSAEVTHTRFLMVTRAPALVLVPCVDEACRDGGHDLTTLLLRGFRERRADIRGEDICQGDVRTAHCGRVLSFTATAEYRRAPDESKGSIP
jgi:hypothetical protein